MCTQTQQVTGKSRSRLVTMRANAKRFVNSEDAWCPNCHAPELNVREGEDPILFIRGNKVHMGDETGWNSHCMRCHVWFGQDGSVTEQCKSDCYCHVCYDENGEYKK